jgi:hypothetical protein
MKMHYTLAFRLSQMQILAWQGTVEVNTHYRIRSTLLKVGKTRFWVP